MTAIDPLRPPAPGTYHYRQEGYAEVGDVRTDVPATGSLVVDPADDSGVQVWHRYIDVDGPGSDVTQVWSPEGVYLLSTVQRQLFAGQTLTISCTFPTPMLVVPWPAQPGFTNTGSCDCSGFQPSMKLVCDRTEMARIDERDLSVEVIMSNLETDGNVRAEGRQVDWVSWDLATIYVRQEIRLSITIAGFEITNTLTSVLGSAEPT